MIILYKIIDIFIFKCSISKGLSILMFLLKDVYSDFKTEQTLHLRFVLEVSIGKLNPIL